jgi:hypothetical protein
MSVYSNSYISAGTPRSAAWHKRSMPLPMRRNPIGCSTKSHWRSATSARALPSSSWIVDINMRRRDAPDLSSAIDTTMASGSAASARLSYANSERSRPHISCVSGSPSVLDLRLIEPMGCERMPNDPRAPAGVVGPRRTCAVPCGSTTASPAESGIVRPRPLSSTTQAP